MFVAADWLRFARAIGFVSYERWAVSGSRDWLRLARAIGFVSRRTGRGSEGIRRMGNGWERVCIGDWLRRVEVEERVTIGRR